MKYLSIASSHIYDSSNYRLDSTYHLNDSIKLKKLFELAPVKFTTIEKQCSDVFLGNIFTRIFVKKLEYGIPYITASDMVKTNPYSSKYISKKQALIMPHLILKEGWILISCSGTLGNVVYANNLFHDKIGTHDLIRVIPNNKEVLGGCMCAYLSSKYGCILLTQTSFGGVVKHISPRDVAKIPVPIFSDEKQKEIHDLIIEASDLRVEANKLLEEACSIIDSNYDNSRNIKIAKYSIKQSNNRMDAFSVIGK